MKTAIFVAILAGCALASMTPGLAFPYDQPDRMYGQQYYSNPARQYNQQFVPLGRGDSVYQYRVAPNITNYQYYDYDENSGRRTSKSINCVDIGGGYTTCF